MVLRVIIFVIIVIALFMMIIYFSNKKQEKFTIMNKYHDIKPMLKTGDIILFSCRKHDSFMDELQYFARTNLMGSEYGHVGLILRNPKGKLYVIEVTDYQHPGDDLARHLNDFKKGGVRIIKLDTLLSEYSKIHMGYYGVKFISKEIPFDIFCSNVEKHGSKIFEYKPKLVGLAAIDILISHSLASNISNHIENKNRITCSEFTHRVLNDCGVLKEYPSKIFWPHIIEKDIFDTLQKVEYSPLYKFTFNHQDENDNK